MKSLIFVFIGMIMAGPALAKIPKGCVKNLEDAVESHNLFAAKSEQMVERGEVTAEDAQWIFKSNQAVAEVVSLLCAGLRKIELERSFFGKIGFISYEKAQREADKAYDEAMAYYLENTI